MNARTHHALVLMAAKSLCKLLTKDEFDLLGYELQIAFLQCATYAECTDAEWWPPFFPSREAIEVANMDDGVVPCSGCSGACVVSGYKTCH